MSKNKKNIPSLLSFLPVVVPRKTSWMNFTKSPLFVFSDVFTHGSTEKNAEFFFQNKNKQNKTNNKTIQSQLFRFNQLQQTQKKEMTKKPKKGVAVMQTPLDSVKFSVFFVCVFFLFCFFLFFLFFFFFSLSLVFI